MIQVCTEHLIIRHLGFARQLQTEMILVRRMQRSSKGRIRRPRHFALLIQQVQDTGGFAFNEINAILVVHIFDFFELDALLDVELLLILQHAQVEKLLQLLVAVVDAKLLKAVFGEEEGVMCVSVQRLRRCFYL